MPAEPQRTDGSAAREPGGPPPLWRDTATRAAAEERAALQRLRTLVDRGPGPLARWDDEDLLQLPRLHRLACSVLARLESSGGRPHAAREVRRLVDRAQVLLYRDPEAVERAARGTVAGPLRRLLDLLLVRGPRAIRAEWRLFVLTFALVYGLAGISGIAVTRDLDLAYSLLPPGQVDKEIGQLEATADGEPFRGNFTFGVGASPSTAAYIMVHNMSVGVLFFAAALVPPVYVLLMATNALMLGTYTAVAGHWGQAGAISSILWCHGVLEIQALILAGTAGLLLFRAFLYPGPWTRRAALGRASGRALELFVPTFALLFLAGLVEGFVSPHAPLPVRLAVAVASGLGLLAWALLGGRRPSQPRARA